MASKKTLPSNISIKLSIIHALSLTGIVVSAIMSVHFYKIRQGTLGFQSFCNLGESMNCDVVTLSPHAELYRGLPISSFASGWFLAIFLISIISRSLSWQREGLRALFLLSASSAIFSVYYFAVMALELKTFCLFCLGIDVLIWGLLATSISLGPAFVSLSGRKKSPNSSARSEPEVNIRLKSNWNHIQCLQLSAIVMVSLLSFLGLSHFQKVSPVTHQEALFYAKSILTGPKFQSNLNSSQSKIGPSSAPITIVEFSDFQCPFCRVGAFTINDLMNRYPRKIQMYFKHYPISEMCNPEMRGNPHPASCEASQVAICAAEQSLFKPVYETLFEQQSKLKRGVPLQLALEIGGINPDQFRACMGSDKPAHGIQRDLDEAKALGIQSTPIFLINGYKIEGAVPLDIWIEVIEQLLKESK